MCQEQQQQQQPPPPQPQISLPVNQGVVSFPPPRHELSAPPAVPSEGSHMRKRPLFLLDKPPLAPRAIQPRPAASTASYSSESSASALLSPSLESITTKGEPPRKRGRPSKAEAERRKAAAEARGEAYPPPRRSGSHRLKAPSTPASPLGVMSSKTSLTPQASIRPVEVQNQELRYAPPPGRAVALMAPIDDGRARGVPTRDPVPTLRELPRLTDPRQTLPSPQPLQLSHAEPVARIDPGERPFEPRPSERFSFGDSSRHILTDPVSRRPERSSLSTPEVPAATSAERRPE
ncbi:hypothetical protein Asppvi_004343 [Aspergillus pseudoviridinutans]|uniref:Uncharacterized protein n=1 Tax=Aspergillus pseudoviridinutans TaxID=1517512 RepID=A0A9P3B688_9EURO|nr:uncharacterized protein Asppvi_004343 [Aspergillus pseudoviridinutans]GIJ85486.1 hypothetical protein Asppvi_004343 [Aspergillus pseudoviridinutans]